MKYCYSDNEESFTHCNDGTREHAAEEAAAEFPDADVVYTGVVNKRTAGQFAPDGFVVIERMQEAASEFAGESPGYWPETTKEQVADLTTIIAAAVDAWADKHKLQPAFFAVDDIRAHDANELREKAKETP